MKQLGITGLRDIGLLLLHYRINFINYMMNIEKTRSLEKSDMGNGEIKMHPAYLYRKYVKFSSKKHKKDRWFYLLCFAKSSGFGRFCLGFFLFLLSELINYIPTQILNVLVKDLEQEYLSFIVFLI